MTDPCHLHFAAIQWIIRYHHGTPDQGLYFSKNPTLQLTTYGDSD